MDGPEHGAAAPSGGVYDWYRRGLELLGSGNADAAAQLLSRAHAAEPGSGQVLEALARALFDARRYPEAQAAFTQLAEARPDDDYARFGLGLTLSRRGDFEAAVQHLSLAATMRPDRRPYAEALRHVRATLDARERAAGVRTSTDREDGTS